MLTTTETALIERAFAIAMGTGLLPDRADKGEGVRITVLLDGLAKAREAYLDSGWGGAKSKGKGL